jgi:hypothetical protein
MDSMSGRVRLASFGSRPLAELARGFLEEHEVDAVVALRHGTRARAVAGALAATMAVLGVWTTVVLLLF